MVDDDLLDEVLGEPLELLLGQQHLTQLSPNLLRLLNVLGLTCESQISFLDNLCL